VSIIDPEEFARVFDPDGEFEDDSNALLMSIQEELLEVTGLIEQAYEAESSKELLDLLSQVKGKVREWPGTSAT
jgi:NTP pyrophosphatase (non-canonical NTP hydrolase)